MIDDEGRVERGRAGTAGALRRAPMRRALAVALSALWVAGASPLSARPLPDRGHEAAYAASPLERDLERLFPGVEETAAFVVHVRPGTAAAERAPAIAEAATRTLEDLRERLGLDPIGKLPLFVYSSSAEMERLVGRPAPGALAIGHGLHVPIDAPAVEQALVELLEPWWGRAGGYIGGSLEEAHWYALHVVVRDGRLALQLDDGAGFETRIETRPGRIGVGIARGRIALEDLKVRLLPEDPSQDAAAPWVRPGLEPEVEGRWERVGERIEGVNYGRMTRARLALAPLERFELRARIRLAAGARAELFMHETQGRANRLVIAPGALLLNDRPAVGPHPVLREGFALAYAARRNDWPLEAQARALLERERLVDANQLRFGVPRSATERTHRRIQAAAFVSYLWNTYGLERYRTLHFDTLLGDATPLGRLEALAAKWREHLRKQPIGREAFARAVRTLGLDVLEPARAWRALPLRLGGGGWRPKGGGNWRASGGRLRYRAAIGERIGYVVAPVGVAARCAIAATLRFSATTRVKISVRGVDRRKSSVVLEARGLQLVADDGSVPARSARPLTTQREHDVVFVLEGGGGRVYVDGRLAVQAQAGLTQGPGRFAIEVDGPQAGVDRVRIRELEP